MAEGGETKEGDKVPSLPASFLKDYSDALRGRVIFFVPFYGAFIAFLVSKSDYIVNGVFTLKIFCLTTFAAGMGYAAFLSETVWLIDSLRLIALTHGQPVGPSLAALLPEKEREAVIRSISVAIKRIGIEYKLFRWMMWLLYITSVVIVWDLFFAQSFIGLLTSVIIRWLPAFLKMFS